MAVSEKGRGLTSSMDKVVLKDWYRRGPNEQMVQQGSVITVVLLLSITATVRAWPHGRVCSYYSYRPRFDSEWRHLSAQRVTRMLNTRLDSFSKNHRLNTPYPTQGNNMRSERSTAHYCIDEKRRRLDERPG